jgi:L-threonylcarbamoyladenylate synthase
MMEQVNFRRLSAESAEIDEAASHLRRGGIVAFPTETVYGLGANASKQAAIEALFALKQRPSQHPLIIHVSGLADASSWAKLNPLALSLIGALWPGPLSIILPRRPGIPMHALAAQKTVALRCPAHPVARALLSRFSALGGKGVAAPSANPFGKLSPTDADHVEADMRHMMQAHAARRLRLSDPKLPDCWLIDGGVSEAGIESTVLDLSTDEPRVLRPGVISREQLQAILGRPVPLIKPEAVASDARKGARLSLPKASGTLLSHYAPHKPLYVLDADSMAAKLEALREQGLKQLALWGMDEQLVRDQGFEVALSLGALPDSPEAIAQVLYRQLRALDESEGHALLVLLPSSMEALALEKSWEAVLDRIERASFATKHGLVNPLVNAPKPPAVGHEATRSSTVEIGPSEPGQPSEAAADALDFDMSFDDFGAGS